MSVEGLHICMLASRGQNLGLIEIINQKDASTFFQRSESVLTFLSPVSPGSEMAPCPYTHSTAQGYTLSGWLHKRRLIWVAVSSLLLKDDSIYSDVNLEVKES